MNRSREWTLLVLTVICFQLGFGVYNAVQMNFFIQEIGISPTQLGLMESLRETAGFLTAFLSAVTMRLAEPLVASGTMLLVAVGMGGYYWIPRGAYWPLVASTYLWSVGFHLWGPLQGSMNLALSEKGKHGQRVGQLNSYGALAAIAAMSLVFLTAPFISLRTMFFVAALASLAAAGIVSRISPDIGHPDKPRLVFKREYGLYYLMTMLEGCRRQIFLTFGALLLVRQFDTPAQTMALLGVINTTMTMLGAPLVGRLIDRLGERKVLTVSYLLVAAVFLGYTLARSQAQVAALFCLDSSLLMFGGIALQVYVRRIAKDADLTPTLAMGMTWNHVSAVIIPLVGGILWTELGYRLLFQIGAAVVLLSWLAAQRMGPKEKSGRA
ncbi:MAG: MFS transporter [Abditibacteriales bacterium]|nr:MFS transporter [Abditibacteriales bacterium]MDW8367464.1 MFS transporter [Abditibacteriales bacterium]